MSSPNVPIPYSYLIVIDFEATCLKGRILLNFRKNSEINNFPCVLYDVKEKKILEVFQTQHPVLTSFCKESTHIKPNDVIYGVPLESCLKMFEDWVNSLKQKYQFTMGDNGSRRCMVATWSDWDIDLSLVSECRRRHLVIPTIMANFIDLRILFNGYYHSDTGLMGAMTKVGLVFEGKQYCGLDNAKNTARLAGKMIDNGVIFKVTSKLNADKTYFYYV